MDQAEADDSVDETQEREVDDRGDKGAAPLAVEGERYQSGDEDEDRQLDPAELLGDRDRRSPLCRVGRRNRRQQHRQRAENCGDVGKRRPVEIERAEHLTEEDQPQQRSGAVEDVACGRALGDEQGEAGAAKLLLELAEALVVGHRP